MSIHLWSVPNARPNVNILYKDDAKETLIDLYPNVPHVTSSLIMTVDQAAHLVSELSEAIQSACSGDPAGDALDALGATEAID